jgi:hypothetical protein
MGGEELWCKFFGYNILPLKKIASSLPSGNFAFI